MHSAHVKNASRGFTLLEAMVALAIVALGMMAVNTQLNRYVVSAQVTEEKTLASWIAANKLTELSVDQTWPALGRRDEDIEFAQRQWLIRYEVLETPAENLRRIDVRVYLADDTDRIVHSVSGFVEPPPPNGYMPVRWSVGSSLQATHM
jgi:general secretion pathway protein I